MARPAQGHDEKPCLERPPGLMHEVRAGTEVDLRDIGRREIQDRCGGDAAQAVQIRQESSWTKTASRCAMRRR